MESLDRRLVIIYNGEIYNYLELREELKNKGYRFSSDSDTEVILHSFDCWKEGCVDKFIGMFAFAIWDRLNRKLFVARDRLGVKPFYYYMDNSQFIFASEIKAILEVPGILAEPNNEAIFEYLHFTYMLGDKTWFKSIKKLVPGHFGYVTEKGLSCSKYWDVTFDGTANSHRTEKELTEELRDLLISSVKLRLRSDVPVGAHLSGGLDSSSVVAIAQREVESLKTFSIGFNEGSSDERRWSNLVKDYLGTDHSVRVVTHHDLPEYFRKITWLLDEPVIAGPVYPQLKLNEMVKDAGVKVVLGGQGGDELFGGYIWHYTSLFRDRLRRILEGHVGEVSDLISDITGLRGRFTMRFLFGGIVRRAAHFQTQDLISEEFKRLNGFDGRPALGTANGVTFLEKQQYYDVKNYLQGLLQLEDRMSMAVSIESRVPLCDHRIVEFAARLPGGYKIRGGETKYLERKAVEPFLPGEIVYRKDKKGFSTPLDEWFDGPLRPWIEEILNEKDVKKRGILDWQKVKQLLRTHFEGRQPMANRIWSLLSVEMWHRCFID
jgi:asparagine synthase (glutamine-hydrolysing)